MNRLGFPQHSIWILLPVSLVLLLGWGEQWRSSAQAKEHPGTSALSFTTKVEASFRALRQTHTGYQLLEQAKQILGSSDHWVEQGILEESHQSRTDATVVRSWNPQTRQETLHREIKILIDTTLPLQEFVLDLAHELTHATTSTPLNPYDPQLTASSYVARSIEGPGGEVDALDQECQVALELQDQFDISLPKRCRRYHQDHNIPAPEVTKVLPSKQRRQKMIADFYRVGPDYAQLLKDLPGTPLSQATPVLISSTGGSNYPRSLFQEYQELTDLACANTRKRVQNKRATPQDFELLKARCSDLASGR